MQHTFGLAYFLMTTARGGTTSAPVRRSRRRTR
jgi:hypothetical protein